MITIYSILWIITRRMVTHMKTWRNIHGPKSKRAALKIIPTVDACPDSCQFVRQYDHYHLLFWVNLTVSGQCL